MSSPSPSIRPSTRSLPRRDSSRTRAFRPARAAFGRTRFLALHEGDQFRSRLLVEAMRQVTFNLIGIPASAPMTWPIVRHGRPRSGSRTKIRTFGFGEPRAGPMRWWARLVQLGLCPTSAPSEHDGRVRISSPPPKMMSLDGSGLVYHYTPLHVMFPDPGYGEPMTRDTAFQRAPAAGVGLDFSAKGRRDHGEQSVP